VACGFASGTSSADEEGMRASHVATALAAFLAGSTAATVLHRRAPRPTPATTPLPTAPVEQQDAVVLPFSRPAVAAPVDAAPVVAAPARCGDSGGRTKAGAPCGARATAGGRCHHHPLAA
jgi:hypothetical protein